MKTNSIKSVTVTTKGRTKHGVEFTLAGVRKHADVPADVLATLAEGEENYGYKWHAPQTKSEVGYYWKSFDTEKDAKADAKRLRAYMIAPAKAEPKAPKATKKAEPKAPKAKKAEPKALNTADLKALFAGLSADERKEILLALFA